MVSSATFAAFSNPVIAKKASATPATMAKTGLPSACEVAEHAEVRVALNDVVTPMAITMIRPATSTKVISMLITTDSVMPMKFTIVSSGMKTRVIEQRAAARPRPRRSTSRSRSRASRRPRSSPTGTRR